MYRTSKVILANIMSPQLSNKLLFSLDIQISRCCVLHLECVDVIQWPASHKCCLSRRLARFTRVAVDVNDILVSQIIVAEKKCQLESDKHS